MNVVIGETVIITALVITQSAGKKINGSVIFREGKKTIGTSRVDDNGMATLQIASEKLGIGEHYIVAYFSGGKGVASSKSEPIFRRIVEK